jgi:hypothetical protein
MMSRTPDFNDSLFIDRGAVTAPLTVSDSEIYFSLIGFGDGWNDVTIQASVDSQNAVRPSEIEPGTIRVQFLEDVRQFATVWGDRDDSDLLAVLPGTSLIDGKFAAAGAVSSASSLVGKFSRTVVALKALFLYQVNYLKDKHPTRLDDCFDRFISPTIIGRKIVQKMRMGEDVPTVQIHRNQPIIPQLAVIFQAHKEMFRNQRRPWNVRFFGEAAMDAGGPGRELVTEAATSIFEPSSQLVVPIGNQNLFIPFSVLTPEKAKIYFGIGFFIAIVVRSSLLQDLPFPVIVWKSLANERVTTDDILDADSNLLEFVQKIRNGEGPFTWACQNWDGTVVTLPGFDSRVTVADNQREVFISRILKFRMTAIAPILKEMRNGFQENAGFPADVHLTGRLLLYLAEGSPLITVEQLRGLTDTSGFSADDVGLKRFWRVLESFNSEQRKLFLKFVTGQSRLPGPSYPGSFRLKVGRADRARDNELPMAVTCFNLLRWPDYSSDEVAYKRLDYAIRNCQTMELA